MLGINSHQILNKVRCVVTRKSSDLFRLLLFGKYMEDCYRMLLMKVEYHHSMPPGSRDERISSFRGSCSKKDLAMFGMEY